MDSSVSLRSSTVQNSLETGPAETPAVGQGDLRLTGTAALDVLPADDPRLHALRQACALLEALELERRQLDQRLVAANKHDPMRVVTGRTSLDEAVEDTRAFIRQLDDMLCEAAETARRQGTGRA